MQVQVIQFSTNQFNDVLILSGYASAKSGTTDQKKVMLDKTIICNEGGVRYLYSTAINNEYSIADDFYYAVEGLPTTYDEDISISLSSGEQYVIHCLILVLM